MLKFSLCFLGFAFISGLSSCEDNHTAEIVVYKEIDISAYKTCPDVPKGSDRFLVLHRESPIPLDGLPTTYGKTYSGKTTASAPTSHQIYDFTGNGKVRFLGILRNRRDPRNPEDIDQLSHFYGINEFWERFDRGEQPFVIGTDDSILSFRGSNDLAVAMDGYQRLDWDSYPDGNGHLFYECHSPGENTLYADVLSAPYGYERIFETWVHDGSIYGVSNWRAHRALQEKGATYFSGSELVKFEDQALEKTISMAFKVSPIYGAASTFPPTNLRAQDILSVHGAMAYRMFQLDELEERGLTGASSYQVEGPTSYIAELDRVILDKNGNIYATTSLAQAWGWETLNISIQD